MAELTPRQTVEELDKYIIGQAGAKRAVAIALRNRYRRSLLPEDVAEEIMPKNIMMMGPTGVGKTEIARRLAKLVKAPFVKVEATKFTEVGYVGRDVESIVRDLVEASIHMVREERINNVSEGKAAISVCGAVWPYNHHRTRQNRDAGRDFREGIYPPCHRNAIGCGTFGRSDGRIGSRG